MSMFPTSEPAAAERPRLSWRRRIGLILLIVIKLLFITAMLNRNISEFVYRGF